jgi:single-stranded DNA-binding protein
MQNIAFVGKMYNKKATGKGDKMRLNFNLAVRKKYVSEEDKKNNKVNVFVPFVAFGKLAELIDQYIDEGRGVALSNCEYTTYTFEDDGETKYGHNFKAGGMDFLPQGEEDAGAKKSTKKKSRRRDEDEDEDEDEEEEEERPRRKKKTSSSKAPAKKKKPVYDDEDDDDDDDDDVPF